MGSLVGLAGSNGVTDAMERTLPFLDEIDRNALAEALLGPKPKVDPTPHTFCHNEELYVSMDGEIRSYQWWNDEWQFSC